VARLMADDNTRDPKREKRNMINYRMLLKSHDFMEEKAMLDVLLESII